MMLGPFLLKEFHKIPPSASASPSIFNCQSTAVLHPSSVAVSKDSAVNLVMTLWYPKLNTLAKAVSPSSSPSFEFVHTLYHSDNAHCCFGSLEPDAHADFLFTLPSACDDINQACSLDVEYLSSWNTSYTGDVTCSVYKLIDSSSVDKFDFPAQDDKDDANKESATASSTMSSSVSSWDRVGNAMTLFGDGHNTRLPLVKRSSTGPMDVRMQLSAPLLAGSYALRCVKDSTPRLACIAGIKISNIK
jgi:hypothetical protein